MIFSLVHLKRVTERNKIVAFWKKKRSWKIKSKKKKKKTKLKKKKEHNNKRFLIQMKTIISEQICFIKIQMLLHYNKRIKNKEALLTFCYKTVVINKYKHNSFVFQVNRLLYYFS